MFCLHAKLIVQTKRMTLPLLSGDKDRWDSGVVSLPKGHPEVIWLTEQLH